MDGQYALSNVYNTIKYNRMKQTYLLITERFDRNGTSEGTDHLLFDDHDTAVDFARRLTLWYAGMPDELPLPTLHNSATHAVIRSGEFATKDVKGEVWTYEKEYYIEWTYQPTQTDGPFGDSHCLTVKPLRLYTPATRLDFWNESTTPEYEAN